MLGYVLDLVFPKICQGCSCEGTYLCLACQTKIKPCESERCVVCSKNSLLGRTHPDCQSRNTSLFGLLVATDYEDQTIRNLVWNLKYNSVQEIAKTLASILADFFVNRELSDYFIGAAVIPVPMRRKKLRTRGFNQAELIASEFAKRTGIQYLPVLEKIKDTESQVELERFERLENMKGAFIARPMPSLGERKIILVDDVATTGATLNECAKALRVNQPAEIWGLVVARN